MATVAWSIATVHHWQDVDAGVAEVHRVLRSGGRFLALERRTTPDARAWQSHGWTPQQAQVFADHLSSHGFGDVTISEHGPTRPCSASSPPATDHPHRHDHGSVRARQDLLGSDPTSTALTYFTSS